MVHRIRLCIGTVLLILGCTMLTFPIARAQDRHHESDDVVVRVQPGVDAQQLASDYGTSVAEHVSGTNLYGLPVPEGEDGADLVQQLQSDPRTVYAEPDISVGDPEVGGHQIHFAFDKGPNPGAYVNQWAYQQVDLGDSQTITTGSGVIVAVLDSGVDLTHPALVGHFTAGYNTITPDAPPLDLPDGQLNDAVGHGTMVAGLIVRLAPGAQIMPVRVLNGDGTGTMLHVVAGIQYAVTNGAKVINMSLGASQTSQALNDALNMAAQAGVLIVASAGNDGNRAPHYPAASDMDNVLAVASVEANDRKSSYSNFGWFIGVVAPGSGIRSTYWTGGYADWSGTSFAAPLVSGEAALVLACHPYLGVEDLRGLIRGTAHSVNAENPQFQRQLGRGIIDIAAAVSHYDE